MLYLQDGTTECLVFATNSMCREGQVRPDIVEMIVYLYVKRIVSRLNIKLWSMCNGPTNARVCNKTLIQMSH
jgi:hypothetical protein